MWQKYFAKTCDNTEIEYNISDDFFEIKCFSSSPKINMSTRLYAVFTDEKSFEIGLFEYEDKMCSVNKKYSLSYLENSGIDINELSHFIIETQDNNLFYAFKYDDEIEEFNVLHILWGVWMLDMILQIVPLKNKLALGVVSVAILILTIFIYVLPTAEAIEIYAALSSRIDDSQSLRTEFVLLLFFP